MTFSIGKLSDRVQTLVGNVEAILSVVATVVIYCWVFSPVYPGQDNHQGLILVFTVLALGIGLAIGGIRFGKGEMKRAAWLSFALLTPWIVILGLKLATNA